MWSTLVLLMQIGWFPSSNGDAVFSTRFTIKAERMEAVEGGPIVIKATLTHQGKEKFEAELSHPDPLSAIGPDNWEWRFRARVVLGSRYSYKTFEPGDQLTKVSFVHHDYSVIPSGRGKIRIDWPIYDPRGGRSVLDGGTGGKLIACPSTILDLDVSPATAERLASIRERMTRTLNRPDVSVVEIDHVANEVLWTKHTTFVPVAFQLLESRASNYSPWRYVSHVYECYPSPAEANAEVLNYLNDPRTSAGVGVFSYWQGPKQRPTLSGEELKGLLTSKKLWIRVLMYVVFGEKCDSAEVKAVLKELQDLLQASPSKELASLLRELDDNRFAVREKATAALKEFDVFAEPALRRQLQGVLSPEARQRIEGVLEKLRPADPNTDARWGMQVLEHCETPEARKVLELLAQGVSDAWMTSQAKEALARRAERERNKR